MKSYENSRTVAPLVHRVAADADATQIADAMVAAWHEIDAALAPIVGQRGIAALYQRSLHLTSAAHSWLAGAHEGVQTAVDLDAFRSVLVQQSGSIAAAGGTAFLQAFYELLTTLVGPSLTEQLLHHVWTNSSGGPTLPPRPQDISQ
jgi:hypothetical protein